MISFGDLRRTLRRRPTRAAVFVLCLAGAAYSFAQSDSMRPSRQKKPPSYHFGPASPLFAPNASGDEGLARPLSWSSKSGDQNGGAGMLKSLDEALDQDVPRPKVRPAKQAFKPSDAFITRNKKTPPIIFPAGKDIKSTDCRPLGADKNVRVKLPKKAAVLSNPSLQAVIKDLPPYEETAKASASPNLEADIALCGMSPCRVLLPGWIGGQDSNVQQEFVQLALLTASLNAAYRPYTLSINEEETGWPYVLVLPNVSKSRMGSCFQRPFGYHFDDSPDSLLSLGIQHTVSFEAFTTWVETRAQRPKAQLVMVEQHARNGALTSSEVETEEVRVDGSGRPASLAWDFESKPDKGKRDYCLDDKASRLVFSGRRPKLSVHPPSGPGPDSWSDDPKDAATMRKALHEALGAQGDDVTREPFEPDVYVLDWGLHSPLFRTSATRSDTPKQVPRTLAVRQQDHLKFSPQWTAIAEDASSKLRPYLAVHWPMETLATELLTSCASALVLTLRLILQQPEYWDIRTIYLATDVPLEGTGKPTPRAATRMTRVREGHWAAMKVVRETFEQDGMMGEMKLKGIQDLVVHEEFNLDALDEGILALLDWIMAANADFFVSGSERCGTQM